jgi:hypothetical protein
MSSTPVLAPQSAREKFSARLALESASRFTAVLLFAVYVSGFFVVSLHNASYGFAATNHLQLPRIVSAGIWFLAFAGIPIGLSASLRQEVQELIEKKDWLRLESGVVAYYCVCVFLSAACRFLFEYPRDSWDRWIFAVVLLVAVVINLISRKIKSRRAQWIAGVIYAAWLLYFVVDGGYDLVCGRFDFGHIVLWFLAIGLLAVSELQISKTRPQRWAQTAFLVLFVLGVFAKYYYPRIGASWGGGAPISIVLYTTPESALSPGQQLEAVLLDDSDAGFYIVPAEGRKAVFLPRKSVAMILFSGKNSQPISPRTESGKR